MRTSRQVGLSFAAAAFATIALLVAGNAGFIGRTLQSLFDPGLIVASMLRLGSPNRSLSDQHGHLWVSHAIALDEFRKVP